MVLSSSSANGRELPQPRWSTRTMRYFSGSKYLAFMGAVPPPGPPWTKSTGLPSGLPYSYQAIVWRSETARRPSCTSGVCAYNFVLPKSKSSCPSAPPPPPAMASARPRIRPWTWAMAGLAAQRPAPRGATLSSAREVAVVRASIAIVALRIFRCGGRQAPATPGSTCC